MTTHHFESNNEGTYRRWRGQRAIQGRVDVFVIDDNIHVLRSGEIGSSRTSPKYVTWFAIDIWNKDSHCHNLKHHHQFDYSFVDKAVLMEVLVYACFHSKMGTCPYNPLSMVSKLVQNHRQREKLTKIKYPQLSGQHCAWCKIHKIAGGACAENAGNVPPPPPPPPPPPRVATTG